MSINPLLNVGRQPACYDTERICRIRNIQYSIRNLIIRHPQKDTADTATGVKGKEGESGRKKRAGIQGRQARQSTPRETRHVVIYGYTRRELSNLMKHFEQMLPDYVKVTTNTDNLVTRITLTGMKSGVELLRFKMNRYQQSLKNLFSEEPIATEDKTVAEVLGGNFLPNASYHLMRREPYGWEHGSPDHTGLRPSAYFSSRSVVSYSNAVKAEVLECQEATRPICGGQPASSDPDGKRSGKS